MAGFISLSIKFLSFLICSSVRWLRTTIKKTANAAVKLKLKIITVFLFISSLSLKLLSAAKVRTVHSDTFRRPKTDMNRLSSVRPV